MGFLKRLLKRIGFRGKLIKIFVESTHFLEGKGRHVIWTTLRPWMVEGYLRKSEIRKLQLGTGLNILDSWLNSDIFPKSLKVIYLNAKRVFPFNDYSFDYIFSEHQIEHLSYLEGKRMLEESFRILKPGGVIRIATLSLESLIELYGRKKTEIQLRYIKRIIDKFLPEIGIYDECFVINNAFRGWGHQFIYDRKILKGVFEEAGFVDIQELGSGESLDENLRNIEKHGEFIGDEEVNRMQTIVFEAKRPGREKGYY